MLFRSAIILWIVVVNIDDPINLNTLTGVAVEVLNPEVLTQEGEIYEVIDGTDNISVMVSAKRSILDYISSSNLRATADLEELNREEGTVRIRIESNKYNNEIESIKSKTEFLKIKIEKLEKATFPIQPDLTGSVEEGFVVGTVSMNQTKKRENDIDL